MSECCPFELPEPQVGIPDEVWQKVLAAQQVKDETIELPAPAPLPSQVQVLMEARQEARSRRDWAAADALRQRISELGWQVIDTPEGPLLQQKN